MRQYYAVCALAGCSTPLQFVLGFPCELFFDGNGKRYTVLLMFILLCAWYLFLFTAIWISVFLLSQIKYPKINQFYHVLIIAAIHRKYMPFYAFVYISLRIFALHTIIRNLSVHADPRWHVYLAISIHPICEKRKKYIYYTSVLLLYRLRWAKPKREDRKLITVASLFFPYVYTHQSFRSHDFQHFYTPFALCLFSMPPAPFPSLWVYDFNNIHLSTKPEYLMFIAQWYFA